ncbi:MAG TPA: hypothetical protein P5234_11030 [Thermoanaerobaculaceae bacterium]|nr:hypothetical protein [Thermoanaerobaculaceae bacterium]HRS16763.1 hypothetical protein [Thermoanaerobaculaceae bacterium]
MDDADVKVALTPWEWSLISSLRDVPEGELKAVLDELIWGLVAFVREPGCSQVQADGVPCPTAVNDCETCGRVRGVLERISAELRSA